MEVCHHTEAHKHDAQAKSVASCKKGEKLTKVQEVNLINAATVST